MNIRARTTSIYHALLLLAVLALNAMNPPLAAAAERLDITGSSTVAPLVAEIAKRFEEEHSDVRIDVQTGGSSRGIADARQGTAGIGMVSRDLKDDEKDLIAFPIARDGIALILHASNPVSALSRDQIIGIYKRNITNWSEVGGPDQPITVVNKAEGRSTLEVFLAELGLEITDIRPHVVIGDNEQGIKVIAGNPDAIGYVSVGSAEFHVRNGTPLKLLPIGSVAPTSENVANGTYEASRTLTLVTNKTPTGLTKVFLDYASSAAADDLIREQYFVPIKK
jgi:phosphate transport system substrate-binding protein